MEIWKTIEGHENYQVSNYGRVKSIERDYVNSKGISHHVEEHFMKLSTNTHHGYTQVMVSLAGPTMCRLIVARLVAKAFIPNPDNLPQVNHKDENPYNNNADNLEWCTCKYNNTYNGLAAKRITKRYKAIEVYNADHEYIETLPYGGAVSEKYNISRGHISVACNTGKIAKGYYFKFSA